MITLDDLTERIAAIISLSPKVLNKCKVEPYLTSDGKNVYLYMYSCISGLL